MAAYPLPLRVCNWRGITWACSPQCHQKVERIQSKVAAQPLLSRGPQTREESKWLHCPYLLGQYILRVLFEGILPQIDDQYTPSALMIPPYQAGVEGRYLFHVT